MIATLVEAFLAPFYLVAIGLAFVAGCGVFYALLSAIILIADEIRDRFRR